MRKRRKLSKRGSRRNFNRGQKTKRTNITRSSGNPRKGFRL